MESVQIKFVNKISKKGKAIYLWIPERKSTEKIIGTKSTRDVKRTGHSSFWFCRLYVIYLETTFLNEIAVLSIIK